MNNRIENNLLIASDKRDNGRPSILLLDTAGAAGLNTIRRQRLVAGEGAEVGVTGERPFKQRLVPTEEELINRLPVGMYMPRVPVDQRLTQDAQPARIEFLADQLVTGQPIVLDTTVPGRSVKRATWLFGDGRKTESPHPNTIHRFAKPGTYRVSVKLVSESGRVVTLHRKLTVKPPPSDVPGPDAQLFARLKAMPVVFEDDFDSLKHWHVEQVDGSARIVDGRLVMSDRGGTTAWLKQPIQAPALIEFTATPLDDGNKNDAVSDLNMFWMAQNPGQANRSPFAAKPRSGAFKEYNLSLIHISEPTRPY